MGVFDILAERVVQLDTRINASVIGSHYCKLPAVEINSTSRVNKRQKMTCYLRGMVQ